VSFVGLSPYLLSDAPAIARTAATFADVLAEVVDDAAIGALLSAYAFRRRFAAALEEPPAALGLTVPLHRALWQTLLHLPGHAVRTSELARSLGVSREHLSRTFHRAAGTPSLKRVTDLPRLLAAAQLATNPGYELADVARLLGFSSSSHLSRTARRLTRCTATGLRQFTTAELLQRFERVAMTPATNPPRRPA
jgi:AraC-like DNA-binding protein